MAKEPLLHMRALAHACTVLQQSNSVPPAVLSPTKKARMFVSARTACATDMSLRVPPADSTELLQVLGQAPSPGRDQGGGPGLAVLPKVVGHSARLVGPFNPLSIHLQWSGSRRRARVRADGFMSDSATLIDSTGCAEGFAALVCD